MYHESVRDVPARQQSQPSLPVIHEHDRALGLIHQGRVHRQVAERGAERRILARAAHGHPLECPVDPGQEIH